MTTWILVANRAGARIFDRDGRKLRLIRTIDHPEGRRSDQDIEPGPRRTFDSHAQGHDARSSPHEQDAESFARGLAAELLLGRTQHRVDRIVLVAEPHFLGLVRQELDDETSRLVVGTLPKDLAKAEIDAVQDHVDAVTTL
jgi:protein required for attachment to host cells